MMKIELMAPVLVESAPRRVRKWGNYQFPLLCSASGRYYYHFADSPDDYASYGHPGWVYSSDQAISCWQWLEDQTEYWRASACLLPNGDRVRKHNVASVLTKTLTLPECKGDFVINNRHYYAYDNEALPLSIGGISLLRQKAGETDWVLEHAPMHEIGGIRCAFSGCLPAMQARCNRILVGPDGCLYLVCYNFQLRADGSVDPYDRVYLMKSTDNGHSFTQLSVIPYQPDERQDPLAYDPDRRGFLEPDLVFLSETHLLCVIRTTHRALGPMYACDSYDGGATWTVPRIIHPYGVFPHLCRLDNGAIILSFGRPGVSVMVSEDDGQSWHTPVTIIPQTHPNVQSDSCGYTDLLCVNRDTCLLAYSDFNYNPGDGYPRKALMSRLIRVV